MKLERTNVEFPLWRKKVDSSLLTDCQTPIPIWAYKIWNLDGRFSKCYSKKGQKSNTTIIYEGKKYCGWVVDSKQNRKNAYLRLMVDEELSVELKRKFIMTYMRDIEFRLRRDKRIKIEEEIPFWEFIDIEYDYKNNVFRFEAYYTQKPSFPELFSRLIKSPSIKKIDEELKDKAKVSIFKQEWKERSEYETEIGAKNVIYMLIDTHKKLLYVGEAKDMIKRFSQGHPSISNWDYYRYNVLPSKLEKYRLEMERMVIKNFSSLLNDFDCISEINFSNYKLVNKKIDK